MKLIVLPIALLTGAFAMQTSGMAQVQHAVPGGATGANVFCIQAGDLTSGSFVATYLRRGAGTWEERNQEGGAFKYEEKGRDEQAVELFDSGRSTSILFDFANKTIRAKAGNSDTWKDQYFILNATDEPTSADCVAFASRSAARASPRADGASPVVMITVRPGTTIVIPPGTQLTAVTGPPCPMQPGFFLCPNKFSCAPVGGVCCPGANSCGPGFACDRNSNLCIGPGNVEFCQASLNPATGIALQCPPGIPCSGAPANTCP